MRGSGPVGRSWVWGAVLTALLAPTGATAEGMFGTAQVQYQRVEDFLYLVRADGTQELKPYTRELWLQTYDLNHRAYPRQNMLLQSSLRLTELSYSKSADFQRTPFGSMRLLHPYANFYVSSQPTLSRVALVPVGGTAADSARATTLETRRLENQFIGHVAVPKMPTLDVSWITRRTGAVASVPGDQSRQRNARLAYDRETWNTFVSWTDQRSQRRTANVVPMEQGIFRTGAAARTSPMPQLGLHAQYDLTDTRSGFRGAAKASTQTHSAEAGADWRHTTRWNTSLAGNLRSTRTSLLRNRIQNDYESSLSTNWQPLPLTRLTAAGGVRSQRLASGANRTLEYLTTLAAGDVQVRPGWRANATASNTVNRDPERGAYAVQTVGGTSRMMFGRVNQFDADLNVTVNGDTGSVPQRYSNAWGTRVAIQPLRGITLIGSLRNYRVGPGLLTSTSISRTRGADVLWRPVSTFDVTGSYSVTGVPPGDAPRMVSRSVTGHWAPRSSVQLTGTWSNSSQDRASTSGTGFVGREFASGRAQVAFTRRLSATGGLTVANPGTNRSAKEYDAMVTWSFGR